MTEINSAFDILWSMPIEDRNVAYLHYCEGMKIDEIAYLLDTKSELVSCQLTSARKRMRQYV